MQRLIIIWLLFYFGNTVYSQTDSQETKIAILKSKITQTGGAERLKLLDSLIDLTFSTGDEPDSLFVTAIATAQRMDSLNYAGILLADFMDYLNNNAGKPEAALEQFRKNRNLVNKIKDPKTLAGIYLNVGDSYFFLKNNPVSIQYYDSTRAFAQKGNAKRLMALAIMYKAGTIGNEGDFAKASQDLQEAVRIFSEIKDTAKIISAKNSLSILYSQNSFFKEAKAERDEAIMLAKTSGKNGLLVSFYYNAATDAHKMGEDGAEIDNLLQSLDYAKKSANLELYESTILSQLVVAYSQQGNITEAERYFDLLTRNQKNTQGSKEDSYLKALKNLAYAKGEYQTALFNGNKHLSLIRQNTTFEDILAAELFLSRVYEKLGNDSAALQHFKTYSVIKDSITDVQKVNALSYYQTIYETEKRDLKISAQQSAIGLLDAENRQKVQWMIFGGLGLLAIFGFILIVRSRNNAKRRQLLQEEFSQGLIKAQEEERTRVARELHDSVGQKLMLLTKKTKSLGQGEMEALAGNTLEELRAISRGLHPAILERLGPTAAIKSMINEVDANTNIFFSHEIENIDALLSKEASLHLYRIIQEVLNNMIKHAEAKSASIIIERKKNSIEARIADNGKGFERPENPSSTASLGMKTLVERAKMLHSKIEINSRINEGTTVSLTIPISNA